MKLIGMVFIVCASGYAGIQIALSLKARCNLFRQLQRALRMLNHEIAFCGTPLPHAFGVLAAANTGLLEHVFSQAAKEMDKRRWLTPSGAMDLALADCQDETISEILRELASRLGKYDRDAQLQGIELAKNRVDQLLMELEQERGQKSKVYQTLCVCTGLAAAILLV